MKKKNIVNLIKYHSENNEASFKSEAIEIAKDFEQSGDYEIADYIMSLISSVRAFIPQMLDEDTAFFEHMDSSVEALPLPMAIKDDIMSIVNAVNKHIGINKFIFAGAPGTGKTETAKQISRLFDRELYSVNFSRLVDSRLGQTQKNIVEMFKEINNAKDLDNVVFLFDEIDAIAMDRINSNDIREMGRVTSIVLKEFDKLNEKAIIIATTNLFDKLDSSLIRRFDYVVDFNRYTKEDLIEVANIILNNVLKKYKCNRRNTKLFNKILENAKELPSPSEMKNIIKTSIAFSNNEFECMYLRKIYSALIGTEPEIEKLKREGFSLREIEQLTGVSKSSVARELQKEKQ